MTVSLAAQFAAHAAVSFVFPQAVAKHGERAVFAFFAAICGAAWLFVRAAVDETRGANLEDIAAK